VAFNGAEPIRRATMDRFAEAFSVSGFRREAFVPCYGLAEATLLVTAGGGGVAADGSAVSCGALPEADEVRVVDPETGSEAAPGAVGEIWVSGPSVASGYWNRPEETAQTFQARLAGSEARFLRTGDLGFVAGGELFVTGRIKDLIILRGRNHYPQDLELTAEQAHAALRPGGSAAFAVDSEEEELLVLAAEVERRSNAPVEEIAEREVQPEGPWLLVGWSFGAVVAYEMARQMERSGTSARFLAMIDPPPPRQGSHEGIDDQRLLLGFAQTGRPLDRQWTLLRENFQGFGRGRRARPPDRDRVGGLLPLDVDKTRLREHFDRYCTNVRALHGYAPRPYRGRTTLFRASGSLAPGAEDLTSGWGALVESQVHLLDADHESVLRSPALDRLVEDLRQDLAKAE